MFRLWSRLEGRESTTTSAYYWILGCTVALTAIGVTMVLSASSVENIAVGASPFQDGSKQGIVAVGGIVLMYAVSRFPVKFLHRLAWPAYFVSVALLLALFVVGTRVGGNLNWIALPGGFSLQPSEVAKLGMSIWLAHIFFRKEKLLNQWTHVFIPAIALGAGIVAIVMIQHDLGTSLVLMAILVASLFFAGVNFKIISGFGGLMIAAAILGVATSGNRMCRITTWVTGQACSVDYASDDQVNAGLMGLASGGIFGRGLGQSRMKYSYLPEAHNDFIFAILGEELGLLGAILIVVLFAILGINIFRVVIRQQELFNRVLGGCIMVWILGQATINMGMVSGLLPVIGVPLPFISYGGSALLLTLLAIGVVLSLARSPQIGTRKRTSSRPATSAPRTRKPSVTAKTRARKSSSV